MFVNVVEFPPVDEGRDADFRAWFERLIGSPSPHFYTVVSSSAGHVSASRGVSS